MYFDYGAERPEERVQVDFRRLRADIVNENGVPHRTVGADRHRRRPGRPVTLMGTVGRRRLRRHRVVSLRLRNDIPHRSAVAADSGQRRSAGAGGSIRQGRVMMDDVYALLRMSAHNAHLLLMLLLVFLGALDRQRIGSAFENLPVEPFNGRIGFARFGEENESASLGVPGIIHEDLGADHFAVLLEEDAQLILRHRLGQIGDVQIGVFDLVGALAATTRRHLQPLVLYLMTVQLADSPLRIFSLQGKQIWMD